MRNLLKSLITVILLCTSAVYSAQPDIAALSAKAVKANYPDAASVLLYDLEKMVCQQDGTSVDTDEFYQKVLNEAGRKKLRTIELHCNTNYGTVRFLEAEILRNGRKIAVDIEKNSTVTTSAGQMSSNIYDPEMKVITLTVPGLEIGDVLHIKTERRTTKPVIPGEWSNIILLESDIPILQYDVEIDTPEAMPLRSTAIKNEIKGTVKTLAPEHKNGRIIYKWQAKDVPQAIPEKGMPKLYTCCQRLLVGTSRSWQDISKWYYALCRPRMDAISDEMRAEVAKLTAGAKDDDEKMRRIFKYVSQNIRYAGVTAEKNAPGFEPHDVCDTFNQKHGVCRDKAALLVSMLELAKLKAFPVIFMAGTPKDSEVPNGYFNHAVVCVDRGNFDYVLMDPTDENTRTLFPEYLSNQSYLVARPEGDTLRRTPVIPAEKNLMQISTRAVIDNRGGISGSSKVKLNGISDLIYRSSFARMTPAKRLEFWQGRVRNALPGAEITSLEIKPENIRNTALPMEIDFTFKAANFLPDTGESTVLFIPQFGNQFGVLNWVLPDTSLEKRRFPIETDSTCKLVEELTLELPARLEVQGLPAPTGKEGRHFSWLCGFTRSGSTVKYHSTSSLDGVEIKSSDYAELKNTLQSFSSAQKRMPVVRKNYSKVKLSEYSKIFPDADAVILDAKDELKLDDEHTFTRTRYRKILVLTYAGVKKHSELKVSGFPSRENVEITAKITGTDGKTRTLDQSHTRLMDAPWTSQLKHIPAEKIKICALPGVEQNSIIEYTVTRKGRSIYPVSGCELFQEHLPILKKEFVIDAPGELKLYSSQIPSGVRFERKSVDKRVIRRWSTENVSGIRKEYAQSELDCFAPHINYSTVKTKEWATAFNKLLITKTKTADKNAVKSILAQVGTSEKSPLPKAISDFVVKNVRIAGPGIADIPPGTIRTPEQIYQSAVATPLERAVLMAALFDAAGIEYRFHLASSKPLLNPVYHNFKYFSPDFETVLLYVPKLNAWFNCSTQYAAVGGTKYAGRLGMNPENGRISAITPAPGAPDRIRMDFSVKIRRDRSAVIDITETVSGTYFEKYNRLLSEMTPELRRRFFTGKADKLDKSAKLNGRYSWDFSGKAGVIKYSVIIPDFVHRAGEHLFYELPGHALLRSKAAVYGAQRTTPFVRKAPDEIILNWRIFAPDGYSHPVSGTRFTEHGNVQFARLIERRSSTAGTANILIKLTLPAAYVGARDFDHLISVQNALGRSSSRAGIMTSNNKAK